MRHFSVMAVPRQKTLLGRGDVAQDVLAKWSFFMKDELDFYEHIKQYMAYNMYICIRIYI